MSKFFTFHASVGNFEVRESTLTEWEGTMKNLTILITGALMLLSSATYADDAISATFSTDVWSDYVVTDCSLVHEGAVIQNDLYAILPNGFYIDLWWSVSPDGSINNNGGDEVDYTLGWIRTWKEITADVSVGYFDFVDLGTTKNGDILSPSLKLTIQKYAVGNQLRITPFVDFNGLVVINTDGKDGR